jgi:hypothetical protein
MSYWKVVNDAATTGNIAAQNQVVTQALTGHNSASAVVTGTWTGTLVMEGSADGSNWVQVWFTQINNDPVYAGIPLTQFSVSGVNTTGNGTYRLFNITGLTQLRCRASAWTTGTAAVTVTVVSAVTNFMFTHGSMIQSVVTDATNSASSPAFNLDSGNSYTFDPVTGTSTLGVAGIQVSLFSNQNCTVKIEQSPDNSNWDLIDTYYYRTSSNFGITVQAVSSYVKVVVTSGGATTTVFRLQTALCPIVEALPRSLDSNGNLKVATAMDCSGWENENTPQGEVRNITPVRLVGSQFDLNGNSGAVDPNFWLTSVSTIGGAGVDGTVVQSNSLVTLSSGTGSAAFAKLYSTRRARYVGGHSLRYRSNVTLGNTGTINNIREWGVAYGNTMPTISDGAFYRLSGTTVSVVTVRATSETVVSNGSFNGNMGATATLTTTNSTFEIYWTNSKVYFVINGITLHIVSATAAPWASTMMHYAYMSNTNTGTQATPLTLNVRNAVIHRLGPIFSSSRSRYFAGAGSGVLKYGPGVLTRIIVNTWVNGTIVSVYDAITNSNPIALITPTVGSQGSLMPFTLEYNVEFYTALYVVVANASSNVTVIYE